MAKIDHVFVLMLENRSFDHLLAFSGLPGVREPSPTFGFQRGAVDQLANDPPHEFDDVAAQINGGAMDGFLNSGGPDAMRGFDAPSISVLLRLARDNLYFDNWFSSMPGPTWPNRLFAHAASSGGLDNGVGALDAHKAVTNPGFHFDFEHGHIFDRLTAKGVPWRVYHHHGRFDFDFPQVLCLKGMIDKRNDPIFFRHFRYFGTDMSRGDVVGYTFIEPKYGLPSYFAGNSQHPIGSISMGERLIKEVYQAIFSQRFGKNSALLITWDEHGGFFDHEPPPRAVPPGDKPINHNRAKEPRNCPFDQFGVRVAAVLISPWLPAGLGSNIFGPRSHFDHASIVRALRSTFSLGDQLTDRDEASPDWNSQLLNRPRTLSQDLPKVAPPKSREPVPSLEEIAADGSPSGNVLGVCQIAVDVDWHSAERMRIPPLIASSFEERMKRAQIALTERPREVAAQAEAHLTVLQYIAAVQARDAKFQTAPLTPPRKIKRRKKRAASRSKKLKSSRSRRH